MKPYDTVSLCPVCFRRIPAEVSNQGGAAVMRKFCPVHGQFDVMVERDIEIYTEGLQAARRVMFPMLYLDITSRCNTKCRFCYYPTTRDNTGDPSIWELLMESAMSPYGVVLTGGEPTMRPDLPEVIRQIRLIGKRVAMFTNGIRLADREYIEKLVDAGLTDCTENSMGQSPLRQFFKDDNATYLLAQISMHPREENTAQAWEKKNQALRNIRDLGLKIFTLMFTVGELSQIDGILPIMREYRDVVKTFRIRAPFNNWKESKGDYIFISDLYKYVKAQADKEGVSCEIIPEWDNNIYHRIVNFDGMSLRLISCPDKSTADLNMLLPYGPYCRALNGETYNIMYSFMVNEGIGKGWINGKRISEIGP
jgi:organic radical activating enzyme